MAAVARPEEVPVLIAGGGPVGLTLSALLARHGIASLVIEADEGYCTGSRAICISRRSQEIMGWAGADGPLVNTGLPWTGGRSYWRDTEVLHFQMPSEPNQRFAPMVNIQQYYIEQFAHEALQRAPELAQVQWSSRVVGVRDRPDEEGVEVDIQTPTGRQTRIGCPPTATRAARARCFGRRRTRRPSRRESIGENEPWEPLWISIYNAKCLTLPRYRYGRVFFAGDAAHLVPIFGVRGLNSGLDDAGNLAWKLARVIEGSAPDELLDSYSTERVHATRENIAYGARSTEFMAPPNFAFKLMREATLRLAVSDAKVRSLINPRQSSPIAYVGSPLNVPQQGQWANGLAEPGLPAPEALLRGPHGNFHLTQRFGKDFICLVFSDGALPTAVKELATHGIAVLDIPPQADSLGQARQRYGLPDAQAAGLVLVRPDGYVMGRWRGLEPRALLDAFNKKGFTE